MLTYSKLQQIFNNCKKYTICHIFAIIVSISFIYIPCLLIFLYLMFKYELFIDIFLFIILKTPIYVLITLGILAFCIALMFWFKKLIIQNSFFLNNKFYNYFFNIHLIFALIICFFLVISCFLCFI